jgi:hypothetical protein
MWSPHTHVTLLVPSKTQGRACNLPQEFQLETGVLVCQAFGGALKRCR